MSGSPSGSLDPLPFNGTEAVHPAPAATGEGALAMATGAPLVPRMAKTVPGYGAGALSSVVPNSVPAESR